MPDANGDRHAVILSGGGAYGAYEVGVLKAMLTGQMPQTSFTPIDPDIFAGTSVGAINAAVLTSQIGSGASAADAILFLEKVWMKAIAAGPDSCGNGAFRIRGDLFRYLNSRCIANPAQAIAEMGEDGAVIAQSFVDRIFNFANASGPVVNRALEFVDLSTFVSSGPIQRLLEGILSLDAIRSSPKALRVVAANWETGEVRVFENKDFIDGQGREIVLASSAIPGFFPPQYIGGEAYVDGGVVMNTPLKCAITAGGVVLHVIYLDPDIDKLPLKVLQNTYNTLDRTVLIHNATVTNEDIDHAAWINEGLETIERAQRGELLGDQDLRAFAQVAAEIAKSIKGGSPYRKLTIHRYHPHYDPGGGGIGILNFERERMVRLIELGFIDTIYHDCDESHCIRPN